MDYVFVWILGYWLGVVVFNNVFYVFVVYENIVNKVDIFLKGDEVKVVWEEVEVDVRLFEGVGWGEFYYIVLWDGMY